MAAMHKHASAAAARVDVERRPCCLRYFRAVHRCIQHLPRGSARCKQTVFGHVPIVASAALYESKLTRKKQ
eukprot:7560481-Alexandrium_andersonii.AAC.1